jgi:hypothetical protein
LAEQVTAGRIGALAMHGASCLIGGIPLTVEGEVVGAIETSGETPGDDEAISIAGAVAHFSVAEVPALRYAGALLVLGAAVQRPAVGRPGRSAAAVSSPTSTRRCRRRGRTAPFRVCRPAARAGSAA